MSRLFLSLLLLSGLHGYSRADPIERELETSLIAAMTADLSAGTRMLSSGAAIRNYIANGLLSKRPTGRSDYTDYRLLRKPATLFGSRLLLITEEYMVKYLGCCVNPGIGAIVEDGPGSEILRKFAEGNACTISTGENFASDYSFLKVPIEPLHYLSIECHEKELGAPSEK